MPLDSPLPQSDFLRLSTDLQVELIQRLSRHQDMAALLAAVVGRVGPQSSHFAADACAIYLIDSSSPGEMRTTATMRAASGYQAQWIGQATCVVVPVDRVSDHPSSSETLGLTGWVVSTTRSFLARSTHELRSHPHWSGQYDPLQVPTDARFVGTFLCVPIRNLRGQVIGAFKAERLEPCCSFAIRDQLALETLARVAGRCLDYEEEASLVSHDSAITLWAREVVAEALASEGELDSFLDIVGRVIAAAVRADSCAIFLADEQKRTLTQRAGCGSHELRLVVRSYKMPEHDFVCCSPGALCDPPSCQRRQTLPLVQRVGLTAWIAATGKTFHARNLAELGQHCHHVGTYDPFNFSTTRQCGAWLGVPLEVGGSIRGVVKVENVSDIGVPDDRDFDECDRRRLDLLAREVALAIERFQMSYATRYQVIQRAMPTITEILSGDYDVPDLVKKVVRETASLFSARACALFLKQGEQLVQPRWAAIGWAERGPEVRSYDLVSAKQVVDAPATDEEKVGLTVWMAVTGRKFTAKSFLELKAHPHYRGTYDIYNLREKEVCESFMGSALYAPGRSGERELVGVLKVETKMKGAGDQTSFAYFTDQDELAFDLIANSAAIAIQNARLRQSRRLADRILMAPDASEVIRELLDFLRNEDVLAPLAIAAGIVDARDRDKGQIVSGFIGVLRPDFEPVVLETLIAALRSPARELLQLLLDGMRACHLEAVHALVTATSVPWAAILGEGFPLRPVAVLASDIFEGLRQRLDEFLRDRRRRGAVKAAQETLQRQLSQVEGCNRFERNLVCRVLSHWSKLCRDELNSFQRIDNPYVAGTPLEPHSRVFVGRSDVFRWIVEKVSTVGSKHALVLHGGWHTGKTSLLRQLESGKLGDEFRGSGRRGVYPVFVDMQRLADPGTDSFLLGVAEAILRSFERRGVQCPRLVPGRFRSKAMRSFDQFLDSLSAHVGGGLLVIMLDEFELLFHRVSEGKIDREIFAYLRSVMQHDSGVTFILAGRRQLDEMPIDYRAGLFNVAHHKEIGFLEDAEAVQLICEPVASDGVAYTPEVVKRIMELSGRHPYFIQQLCYACVEHLNIRMSGCEIGMDQLQDATQKALLPGYAAQIEILWADTDSQGKALLRIIASETGSRPFVDVANIARRTDMGATEIRETLHRLQLQRLLTTNPGPEGPEYCFAVELMRLWVVRQFAVKE